MTKTGSSNLRSILTIVFSFFISFFLFLLCGIIIVQSTVFNPDFMRSQLSKSHYYENVTAEVEDAFISYGSASGFDEPFFKTVIDLNNVQLNVNESLSVLYGSSKATADTTDFEQKLKTKLTENVKNRGISVTADTEKGLQLLAKTCADTYTQYISIPYAKELAVILQTLKKPLIYAEIALSLFIIILAILISALNRWRHRAIRAYIYAVSGTMLMLFVLFVTLLLSGKINRIALISKSLYEFFVCYLTGFAFLFLQFTLILGVVLAILALLYRSMLKQIH